jgi:hypothetical protein
MAPAARSERAGISEGRKPTDGPMMAVEARKTAVMCAGLTRDGCVALLVV